MIDKIKSYYKIIIVILIFIILFSLIFVFEFYENKKIRVEAKEKNILVEKKKEKEDQKEKEDVIDYFYVDIKGAVNNPGVYKLEKEKRVIDVINMAGGLIENADTSIINLSKKINDEMIIIVYTKDELKEYKDKLVMMEEVNKKMNEKIMCPDTSNDSCINKNNLNNKNTKELSSDETTNSNSLISINSASKEELMTISGIGENKAESIVKYREENGEFGTIEDIKKVSGIGDSLYEKIKDYITT